MGRRLGGAGSKRRLDKVGGAGLQASFEAWFLARTYSTGIATNPNDQDRHDSRRLLSALQYNRKNNRRHNACVSIERWRNCNGNQPGSE